MHFLKTLLVRAVPTLLLLLLSTISPASTCVPSPCFITFDHSKKPSHLAPLQVAWVSIHFLAPCSRVLSPLNDGKMSVDGASTASQKARLIRNRNSTVIETFSTSGSGDNYGQRLRAVLTVAESATGFSALPEITNVVFFSRAMPDVSQ